MDQLELFALRDGEEKNADQMDMASLEGRLKSYGYCLDDLERDNPLNAWFYQNDDAGRK
jgi:hypothetical protein